MVFLSDSFTDTDYTLLTAHAPEIGGAYMQHPVVAGQFTISPNKRAFLTTSGVVYNAAIPPTADYDVEADIVRVSTAISSSAIIGRADTTAATFYMARWEPDGGKWELYKSIAGAFTLLNSVVSAFESGATKRARLSLSGTTQQLYVDGVLVCSASDTAITAAGRVGLRGSIVNSFNTGIHIDNISATNTGPLTAGRFIVSATVGTHPTAPRITLP